MGAAAAELWEETTAGGVAARAAATRAAAREAAATVAAGLVVVVATAAMRAVADWGTAGWGTAAVAVRAPGSSEDFLAVGSARAVREVARAAPGKFAPGFG